MGIEFHQTGYGRRFFEGQLPALIKALERIADRMAENNMTRHEEDPAEEADLGVPDEDLQPHFEVIRNVLRKRHAEAMEKDGVEVADRALAATYEVMDRFLGRPPERVDGIRAGLKRGAELVRAYSNVCVNFVHKDDQQQIQEVLAGFLDEQARTYGTPR